MGISSSVASDKYVYYNGCIAIRSDKPLAPMCLDNPDVVGAAAPPAEAMPGAPKCYYRGCKAASEPVLEVQQGRCRVKLRFLPMPYDALQKLNLTSDLKLGRVYTPLVKLYFCRQHRRAFLHDLRKAIQIQLGNLVAQQLGDFLMKQVINVYGGALGFDPSSVEVWQEAIEAECA